MTEYILLLKINTKNRQINTFVSSVLILFLSSMISLNAQDISRSVIGNNGSYYSHLIFGDLHFTVGEVAVSNLTNEIELGEGFHRSYYELVVDTKEILPQEWTIKIYPNPATESIQINLPDDAPIQLFLYNNIGQLVQEKRVQSRTEEVDLTQLPAGIYWLQLSDDEGKKGIFQIQKISL